MSYLALHMDKFKKEAVRGIQSHNQRERKSRSNPDIDYSRSGLNYDLHNVASVNYQRIIDARVDSLNLKKSIRHDAVHMCGLVVSSDTEFFDGLGAERTRQFFEVATEYLERFVGPENVIAAVVHMDETTPHLHFVHVPVTADGRLNANKIYTRESLKKLQAELPRYLQSRGFDIHRGVEQKPGAAKKHLDTREFKQQREAINNLNSETAEARRSLKSVQGEVVHIQQLKTAESAKLKEVARAAQEAETILRQEHELPKPGLLVSKSNYQQALAIIERQKQALADKNQVQARNRYLEAQQANFERRVATVEQEAADKIRRHEEALQAVKRELRQREESHRAIMDHYSRELKDYRRLKEEDDARKKAEREQEMFDRSQRARAESQQRALDRLAASESKSPEPPAAKPPELEKKSGFTLGR